MLEHLSSLKSCVQLSSHDLALGQVDMYAFAHLLRKLVSNAQKPMLFGSKGKKCGN